MNSFTGGTGSFNRIIVGDASINNILVNSFTGTTGSFNFLGMNSFTGGTGSFNRIIVRDASINNILVNSFTGTTGSFNFLGMNSFTGGTGSFDRIIVGDASINNILVNSLTGNTVTASGQITASTFNATSDYRIKSNITSLDETYIVDKLNPVTYLNKQTDKQDIGLIAHELQEIYPILVNGTKDDDSYQNVNYIGLIPVLIKEIQTLKQTVTNLNQRIKTLEEKP